MSETASLDSVSPFFIVNDIRESVAFYQAKLGFSVPLLIPEDDPFFAIVQRDKVSILLKQITADVHPIPNSTRHEWARWDAFIHALEPDSLYEEYTSKENVTNLTEKLWNLKVQSLLTPDERKRENGKTRAETIAFSRLDAFASSGVKNCPLSQEFA